MCSENVSDFLGISLHCLHSLHCLISQNQLCCNIVHCCALVLSTASYYEEALNQGATVWSPSVIGWDNPIDLDISPDKIKKKNEEKCWKNNLGSWLG